MIKFCKRCIMPDTRPRIVFDHNGVCNACLHSDKKNKINWANREEEFFNLIEDIKNHSKKTNAHYDCVVPWSGGKDSTSIALKLKFEHELNPLLVTFSPLLINECGRYNREEVLKMGFD